MRVLPKQWLNNGEIILLIINKTTLKKNKDLVDSYFEEHCQSIGTHSIIQLKPIIDWKDEDVWNYINKYSLPINPEYKERNRVGCIICPNANFTSNSIALMKYPKLIDAFIHARETNCFIDWMISSENLDCINDKCYYICRLLNHSFMPFSKKQYELYLKFRAIYDKTIES